MSKLTIATAALSGLYRPRYSEPSPVANQSKEAMETTLDQISAGEQVQDKDKGSAEVDSDQSEN